MDTKKKVFSVLVTGLVCAGLRFVPFSDVQAQGAAEPIVTADSLLLTAPAEGTLPPSAGEKTDITPSPGEVAAVQAPQIPENSNSSNAEPIATADSLLLTAPAEGTPTPPAEETMDTVTSSDAITADAAIDTPKEAEMPKVKQSKLKNGTIIIKWKKMKGVSKYQIKVYNEKNGKQILNKKTKQVCFRSKLSDVKNMVLRIKVRAYSKSAKKWSKWNKVKVK